MRIKSVLGLQKKYVSSQIKLYVIKEVKTETKKKVFVILISNCNWKKKIKFKGRHSKYDLKQTFRKKLELKKIQNMSHIKCF